MFIRYVLDTIKPLTLKLQKRDMDIFIASKLVEEHVDRIKEIRRAKDTEFESCFEDAKQIADEWLKPQEFVLSSNTEKISTNNPRDYYRSDVAIPFWTCSSVIKYEVSKRRPDHIFDMFFFACQYWRHYCVNMSKETSDKLCSLLNFFNFVDGDVFPNVKILLHIGCVLPITTCEAERSFSGLRYIKIYMRNTMQEDRLAGLALMYFHNS